MFRKGGKDCSIFVSMKISEGSPSTQHIFTLLVPLITHFWIYFRFRFISYLIVVILAKLGGLEDLALFRQCYVKEVSSGLGLRNLGSVPDVSFINYESG